MVNFRYQRYVDSYQARKLNCNSNSICFISTTVFLVFPQAILGVIDRNGVGSIGIDYQVNDTLDILVENQGHINFMLLNDPKGIIQNVTLHGVILTNWTIFPLRLDPDDVAMILNTSNVLGTPSDPSEPASFYVGSIPAMPDGKPPLDTFLYLKNWSKVS